MKKLLLILGLALTVQVEAKNTSSNTETIKQRIIQESIESYPGNCPCPYNIARNGSRCGKRSAYNRAGGYAPICCREDVTAQMIKDYRARH